MLTVSLKKLIEDNEMDINNDGRLTEMTCLK